MNKLNKKHILFLRRLPKDGEMGGLESLMFDWFQRIDYSKCDVTLAVSEGWVEVFDKEIKKVQCPINVVELPAKQWTKSFKSFWKMMQFLKELKPNIMVCVQGKFTEFKLSEIIAGTMMTQGKVYMHENLGAPEAIEKPEKKYLGVIPSLALWWHRQRMRLNFRALLAAKILVVSREMLEKLITEWGYQRSKVEVSYHGIDLVRYCPSEKVRRTVRQKLNIGEDDTVLICTARFSQQKRLERAIKAFDILSQEYPKLRLVLLGQGPLENELRAQADSSSAKDRIHFLGQVDDVAPYLKMSDIYVLSSDNEGLSLSFLEAMASGLICVSTKCTGSSEVIKSGTNGYLVEKNTDALREGIQTVLDLTEDERKKMSENTVNFIKENFEINNNVKKIFEITNIPFAFKKSSAQEEKSHKEDIKYSILIMAYNRANDLKKTLDCLKRQVTNGEFAYEILLVDNNSTDNTRQMALSTEKEINSENSSRTFRYILEAQQGKTYALNRGIKESLGDILVFTDDDVTLDENWLSSLNACFEKYQCDIVGGRVLPSYPEKTPRWVKDNWDVLRGPIVAYDYGDKTKAFEKSMLEFIGANVAIKKEVFADVGTYRHDLGPGKINLGEDIEIFNRIREKGKKIYYCGEALVLHPVDFSRMSLRYIAKWNMNLGRYRIMIDDKGQINDSLEYYFGVPRYLIRIIIQCSITSIVKVFNKREFLKSWKNLFINVGKASEIRRIYKCTRSA